MRRVVAILLALASVAAGCSRATPQKNRPAPVAATNHIVVASFDFSESALIADLYATVLKHNGYPVRRAFDLGPREIVEPALLQGRVDLVPEYLGTALSFVTLGKARLTAGKQQLYRDLQRAFQPQGVDPLTLSSAKDQNGIVVTEATAARYGLSKISDLKPVASKLVFGGPPECPSRPFCLQGLSQTYGLHFEKFQATDAGGPVTVSALQSGAVDVAVLFTSDPSIVADNFVLLRDDRKLQPPDNVVPVVRRKVLKDYGGGVERLINAVTKRLDTEILRRLNARVELDGAPIHRVAVQWLRQQGLI